MKWRRLCLLHALIFFITIAILVPRVISVETKVYVHRPVVTASVGETFTISVKISYASDVFCWQFMLEWNATVLDFVSVVEGEFLKRHPTEFVYQTEQDEVDTDYVAAGCTKVGKWRGESGSGTLATVTFNVTARGETLLHFRNPGTEPGCDTVLVNPYFSYLPFTAVDGLFTNVAGLPVPSFTYLPSIPEIGENVTFDASASYDPDGYIVSYFWEFGDDNTANVTEPITYHAYSEAGDYVVTLTVTDNASLPGTISKALRVRYPHDVAIVSVSPNPTEVAAGETVTITVIALNDGTEKESFTVTVYYGDNVIGEQSLSDLPAAQNRTLTFNWNTAGLAPGTYRIKATASVVEGETDTGDNSFVDGTVRVNPGASEPLPVWIIAIAAIVAIAAVGGAVFFFMRRKAS